MAEYCFERVLFRRRELTEPHWVLRQTRWVLRQTRWVRVCTQRIGWEELSEFAPRNSVSPENWKRGSGGVQSTGVSQSVRETGRDESQSVLSPEKLFKTRDLELPFFEGSFPSCSPHSAGYTRTFLHPYFPVAKRNSRERGNRALVIVL